MAEYTEGKAVIKQDKGVFLNPNMHALRDISVLFLKHAAEKDAKLLDATSATGIRGIRYSLEAGIRDITLIDINESAYKSSKQNLKTNKIKAVLLNQSLEHFVSSTEEKFDIIDLDPFGTPVPYVNDAMKIASGNAILMVTATDTAVLCGAHSNACLKLYGAKPLHNELCKEAGIRILIGFIARVAAQFNKGISVMLSVSDLHYMRVFIRLLPGASNAVASVKSSGFVAFCPSCRSFETVEGLVSTLKKECRYCGAKREMAGPMWLKGIYDKALVKKMLSDPKGMSEKALEQLETILNEPDSPFFYSVSMLTKMLRKSSISPRTVISKLSEQGYRAAGTQFGKDCVKTDAALEDVLSALS